MIVDVNGNQSNVTHTQVVSPAIIGQLQPGASAPVKVDPNDHSQAADRADGLAQALPAGPGHGVRLGIQRGTSRL